MNEHLKISKLQLFYFGAAIIICTACAYFCARLLTPSFIEITMDVQLEKTGNIKIFYLGEKDQIMTELNSVESKNIPAKQLGSISFQIPVKKMDIFRLDFQHPTPGANIIQNIKLKGRTHIDGKNLSINGTSDIQNITQKDSTLTLNANGIDPHIIFALPKTLHGKQNYDIFLLGIIFVFSLMLLGGILYILIKSQKNGIDILDIIFVSAIIILLCIPSIKINHSEISEKENRTLAIMPELMTRDGQINTLVGQQFDKWFNDRFFGREYLVKGYQKLNTKINRIARTYMITPSVVEGKDGWYFYTLKNSIRNFQNLDVFSEKEMEESLANLKKMDEWCKKNGIKFYYMIAPDKNKVYGEYLTAIPKVYPDSASRANQWVNYIRKNSDIKVIFPTDELKKQRDSALLYYKCDTHWNFMGAYYGYKELMKLIKKDFPDLNIFEATEFREEKGHNGDLYALAPQMVKKDNNIYQIPNLHHRFFMDTSLQIRYSYTNPSGKYNAFIMRDSFANGMLPFFNYTFNNVISSWQFILRHDDLPLLEQKDIVILEHVERNLPTVGSELKKLSSFFDTKE